MSKKVYHMGLDIGSTTIKIVITDEYDICFIISIEDIYLICVTH